MSRRRASRGPGRHRGVSPTSSASGRSGQFISLTEETADPTIGRSCEAELRQALTVLCYISSGSALRPAKPGSEMLAAIEEPGAPDAIALIDRDIRITLSRFWGRCGSGRRSSSSGPPLLARGHRGQEDRCGQPHRPGCGERGDGRVSEVLPTGRPGPHRRAGRVRPPDLMLGGATNRCSRSSAPGVRGCNTTSMRRRRYRSI